MAWLLEVACLLRLPWIAHMRRTEARTPQDLTVIPQPISIRRIRQDLARRHIRLRRKSHGCQRRCRLRRCRGHGVRSCSRSQCFRTSIGAAGPIRIFGARLPRIGIYVALRAPVIKLRAIRVGLHVTLNIGSIFCHMRSNVMTAAATVTATASASGHDWHGHHAQKKRTQNCLEHLIFHNFSSQQIH